MQPSARESWGTTQIPQLTLCQSQIGTCIYHMPQHSGWYVLQISGHGILHGEDHLCRSNHSSEYLHRLKQDEHWRYHQLIGDELLHWEYWECYNIQADAIFSSVVTVYSIEDKKAQCIPITVQIMYTVCYITHAYCYHEFIGHVILRREHNLFTTIKSYQIGLLYDATFGLLYLLKVSWHRVLHQEHRSFRMYCQLTTCLLHVKAYILMHPWSHGAWRYAYKTQANVYQPYLTTYSVSLTLALRLWCTTWLIQLILYLSHIP